MNYFELFNLPQAPSIDRSQLAKKYFELQKQNHPDFFTQATENEKEEALEQSASINKAFNIFQDEQKTIEYFLQVTGLVHTDEKYNLPPEFLMDMMEINEAVTEQDIDTVKKQVSLYADSIYAAIGPIIKQYNVNATEQNDLLKLKEYYYKKKYLTRILDRLGD